MATIQSRLSKGHKYWYIVESRRINGKPRPIPLAYLGKAEDLLKRLEKGGGENFKSKSYSHGAVAALLKIVDEYSIIDIINKYVPRKAGKNGKQIRDGITVGASLVIRMIEKVCSPCSNREFSSWAKTTSLEYLLRISAAKLDSQHFWDQMNELPVEVIPEIETEIIKQIIQKEKIKLDTLLLDATNFFTFISTTNENCSLAQRGKNKQGRKNLRQVGVLMVVSRKEIFPLFHETYMGNVPDCKLFESTIKKITHRLSELASGLDDLTLVFDRGNNSKTNLSEDLLNIHYVGALSQSHHKDLMCNAILYFSENESDIEMIDNEPKADTKYYRVKQELWGELRTLVVYKSKELFNGQLRGIKVDISKKCEKLEELNQRLANPRSKKMMRKEIIERINSILKGQFSIDIITWNLKIKNKCYKIEYDINENELERIKKECLGFRILMTNRHSWKNDEILAAYHGQSKVEYAFRNLKNPFHCSLRPQYHWTDQKIRVHVFTCVLGFLLESIIYHRVKSYGVKMTNYDNLFDSLNKIRLATLIEKSDKRGSFKPNHQLEETGKIEKTLLKALDIADIHIKRPKIKEVVVYK